MKKQYLLFFLLLTMGCFAQFSKTHYIPPLSGTNDISGSAQEQYLYISTPNINPVNVRIIQLGGTTITATVSKSTPYVFNAGFGTNTQLMVEKSSVNSILSNKGYIIDADDLVYVSARVIAGSANQSGALISKGLAALGTDFRIGSLLNTDPSLSFGLRHYTFVSILATENNTLVQFSDIKPGVILINNAAVGNVPSSIILNSGQSFVMAVEGPTSPFDADQRIPNRDGLIGSLVKSDKPIALNCGSFAGTNADNNLDLGFDQIVTVDKTGKNYIFIKSTGQNVVEKVLLVGHTNGTEVRLNGNIGPYDFLLNAGQYLVLDGSRFNVQGNLYVNTTENVFAYQTIGDNSRTDFANQEMFFVPPLNCETPRIIDNIPLINKIGNRTYSNGRITMITESGATVNFQINGNPYSIATLNSIPGVVVNGPTIVSTVLQNYDTYVITGLSGNISAFSTGELYVAAYATDGAATFGGFYSGFIFKPEITFNLLNTSQTNCIPNAELRVNSLSSFDVFQWYFNGNPIAGATQNFYNPLQPGYYYVKAAISNCSNNNISSDEIPISSCPLDTDNDAVNDNVDIDFDNDGIANCTESLGDLPVDLSNMATINVITAGSTTPNPVPFSGAINGNFITRTPIGKNNKVTFQKTFPSPTNISIQYVNTALLGDLPNINGDFVITCDINKTITLINPNDQLLVDTNYDNIFESGVTSYSSYEIRFRINNAVVVTPGLGTFRFKSAATSTITFKHTNLSDATSNNATFRLVATCVPRDSDLDGVPDAFDLDSDNDGIPDLIEALANSSITPSNIDANLNGMDDAFGNGIVMADSDGDGVADFLDLDSDNDGIYDLIESGAGSPDITLDGRIDGTPVNFGTNGLYNTLETFPNSGILNYTIQDTNADGIRNYISLDSDGDGCDDVIEAGYLDPNGDGRLGNAPQVTNSNGLVTSALGYTVLPNNNYNTGAPITITAQPSVAAFCTLTNSAIVIESTPVDTYQWQVLVGGIWTNIVDNANYAQSNTNQLQVIAPPYSFNGYKYRVILQKNGNSCNLTSAEVTLSLYALPTLVSPMTLVQCDNDNDGFTRVNLRQNEAAITNTVNRVFTYYKSYSVADAGDETHPDFINNPLNYFTNSTIVWVRVVDLIHGCYNVSQLNVTVSATQIPSTFNRSFYKCDDFLDAYGNNNNNNDDRDGIATFNFGNVTAAIIATLPTSTSYRIKYYKNYQDASMEVDAFGNNLEISQNPSTAENIFNYRNREYPSQQQIWVRVESIADNACFGLGPYVNLYVEALPVAYPYNDNNIIRKCDDDQDGVFAFDTSMLQSIVLNGQTNVAVTYFDQNGSPLSSPLPNPFIVNSARTITVRVTNTATSDPSGPCYEEETIQFIVDKLPQAFPVNTSLFSVCDDEDNPVLQDSMFGFDTATIQSQILNGQAGMIVRYYNGSGQEIQSPLPNPFNTASQNITAVVENPINRTCPASIIIPFVVKATPKIKLFGRDLICSNDPAFFISINAAIVDNSSISNYTFQWYLDGTLIPGATNYTLDVNVAGTYTVDVTTVLGCLKTRIIDVVASDVAHIDDIKIIDLTNSNSVEILASGSGLLVYSIDDPDDFQSSNIFYDVPMGIHQIYIKDTNGCGVVGPIEIYVLGIPKFFTPDNNGINDTWNLKGSSTNYNKNARIRIFDRHGKFIKEIFGADDGWDGTYHGHQLPSDDYWYVIELEDQRIFRGHFSLTR